MSDVGCVELLESVLVGVRVEPLEIRGRDGAPVVGASVVVAGWMFYFGLFGSELKYLGPDSVVGRRLGRGMLGVRGLRFL